MARTTGAQPQPSPTQPLPRTFMIPLPLPMHPILVLFGSHPEFAERHWSQI
jgi:hypothetical protein